MKFTPIHIQDISVRQAVVAIHDDMFNRQHDIWAVDGYHEHAASA